MVREAVIVDSVRTGLTKAPRGSFNMTHPVDYLAHTLGSVVDRVPNLDSAEVGDVITGCATPEGSQGMNMSRIAAMAAGFPKEIAGTTVNRFCSSGSQAVMMAAHQVINEGVDVAIGAGGETVTGELSPEASGGTQMGKRYADTEDSIEILCTKPGEGSLGLGNALLDLKEAKPLPASD